MTWDGAAAEWWASEVVADAAYSRDVDPLLEELLPPSPGVLVDLGCGTGRLLTPRRVGVDSSVDLLGAAQGSVVAGELQRLPFGDASFAGAYAVLVWEHLAETGPAFAEAKRVVKPSGFLVMILNHPLFTAPGSGPFLDDDGEALWRFGGYLTPGHSDEPAGDGSVRFHHHPLGDLLGGAADAGWVLERLVERPSGDEADPLLRAQAGVPRLLGVRWAAASSNPSAARTL